jgi:hypothetical protein
MGELSQFFSTKATRSNLGQTVVIRQPESKPKQSDQMLEFHKADDPDVNLDAISLSSVINKWANSHDPIAGRQPKAMMGQHL